MVTDLANFSSNDTQNLYNANFSSISRGGTQQEPKILEVWITFGSDRVRKEVTNINF